MKRKGFGIEGFLNRVKAGESSKRTYREILETCEKIHRRPLDEATEKSLEAVKTVLQDKRSGAAYVRRMRAFYKVAARATGRRDHFLNLADVCVMNQESNPISPDELLTKDDVNRMLTAANSLRDRALVAVLWAVGQRVSAVTGIPAKGRVRPDWLPATAKVIPGLRLRDVTIRDDEIELYFHLVKVDGHQHRAFVHDQDGMEHVRKWVEQYPYPRTENAPLFPSFRFSEESEPEALVQSGALKIVESVAVRAGIMRVDGGKRVYPHLFRHSRACYLRTEEGLPWDAIKSQMGWSQGSKIPEKLYGHITEKFARSELRKAHGLPLDPDAKADVPIVRAHELPAVLPMVPPPGMSGPRTVRGVRAFADLEREREAIEMRVREKVRAELVESTTMMAKMFTATKFILGALKGKLTPEDRALLEKVAGDLVPPS